ncbi:MAG: hypothetical protein ACAI34_15940 [Verrucomicrobium sp.]|nr:hypothetical protein [Verrucomicrobium sp.]
MKTFIPNLAQVKKSSGIEGLDEATLPCTNGPAQPSRPSEASFSHGPAAASKNLCVNSYSPLGNPAAILTGKVSGLGSSLSNISEGSGIPMEPDASGALLMAVTGVLIILRRRRACRGA